MYPRYPYVDSYFVKVFSEAHELLAYVNPVNRIPFDYCELGIIRRAIDVVRDYCIMMYQ